MYDEMVLSLNDVSYDVKYMFAVISSKHAQNQKLNNIYYKNKFQVLRGKCVNHGIFNSNDVSDDVNCGFAILISEIIRNVSSPSYIIIS